jgi:hypothetical protein
MIAASRFSGALQPRNGADPAQDTPSAPAAILEAENAPLDDLPSSVKRIVARALAGTASPRAAIKAKCLECVGFVRADITTCTAAPGRRAACPLWPYRPYQQDEEGDDAQD